MTYNTLMKKRIGLFLDTEKTSGGAFQDAFYTIQNLKKFNKSGIEFVLLAPNLDTKETMYEGFKVIRLKFNYLRKLICFLRANNYFVQRLKKRFFFKNYLEQIISKYEIDLVLFLNPSQYVQYLEDTNYIITIPDVCHRKNLEFPEVRNESEFEIREDIFKKYLPKSYAVITNSELIKKDIIKFFNVDEKRIVIVHHQPSSQILNFKHDPEKETKIIKKYNLPKKFFFYPAQYWPHKNHIYLVDGLEVALKELKFEISAVFCGSDKGNLNFVKVYCEKKKLNDKILFLDFVENHEIPYLYKLSHAIVMPTYFGPTNLPPLEAFQMGVPVIYSNFSDFKKEFENSVLYSDLNDPSSLAKNLKELSENTKLRQELIEEGKKKISNLMSKKTFMNLFNLFEEYFKIQSRWK